MSFNAERGIAFCGLACVSCSAADCPGCKRIDQTKLADCKIARCCIQRGAEGCWACADFPCTEQINPRVRAFLRCAKEDGIPALMGYLRANDGRGVVYHRGGGLRGDYDDYAQEDVILDILRTGALPGPYDVCPAFETRNLRLQLVDMQDAEALLDAYADPVTRMRCDSAACSYGFSYDTLEGMRGCIASWREEFGARRFIRWTIHHKQAGRPVGTIEYFVSKRDRRLGGAPLQLGILRMDVLSAHESEQLFGEILDLLLTKIARLMPAEVIIGKAAEDDPPRLAAYRARGFARCAQEGAPAYYMARSASV